MNDKFLNLIKSKTIQYEEVNYFHGIIAFTFTTYAQDKWSADPYHSSVNFAVKHSNISMVNGNFWNIPVQ